LNHEVNLSKNKISNVNESKISSSSNITPNTPTNNNFLQELSIILVFNNTLNDSLLINSKTHYKNIKNILLSVINNLYIQY